MKRESNVRISGETGQLAGGGGNGSWCGAAKADGRKCRREVKPQAYLELGTVLGMMMMMMAVVVVVVVVCC